jgi:hypothetical protein
MGPGAEQTKTAQRLVEVQEVLVMYLHVPYKVR